MLKDRHPAVFTITLQFLTCIIQFSIILILINSLLLLLHSKICNKNLSQQITKWSKKNISKFTIVHNIFRIFKSGSISFAYFQICSSTRKARLPTLLETLAGKQSSYIHKLTFLNEFKTRAPFKLFELRSLLE